MKIAVSGKNGQLAQCLRERALLHDQVELVHLGRPEFDLLDPNGMMDVLSTEKPDIVVSAAAYTAVDAAENEPGLAFAVNADGAGGLASAAEQVGAAIIHLSTDYVFPGDKGSPYDELDAASPLGAYGLSKYAGELAVAAANGRSLVLRTAWAHSPYGRNFVRSMLELALTRKRIQVVADRYGSPTSMLDVADAVLHIAGRLKHGNYGIYHLANRGGTNWADFARHIFAASDAAGGPWAEVEDIPASEYKAPAPRPENSQLNSAFFERTFSWAMPSWQESATVVAQRLARQLIFPKAGE